MGADSPNPGINKTHKEISGKSDLIRRTESAKDIGEIHRCSSNQRTPVHNPKRGSIAKLAKEVGMNLNDAYHLHHPPYEPLVLTIPLPFIQTS